MSNTKRVQLISGLPQTDWNETDETKPSYLKNKPTTLDGYGITDAAKADDLSSHTENKSNPHNVTKSQVGLENVENKSSATIRGEITSSDITAALGYTPLSATLKGANGGIAELDENGKVPSSQLPSYFDDYIEGYLYNNKFYKESSYTTEISGESGKIYVDLSTEKTYRWSGSIFIETNMSLELGETSSTAYRGDRGKIAYDHSQTDHAPSDAEKNQNAFSNIVVGSTTITAGSATDMLTLVAVTSGIAITADATSNKISIANTYTLPVARDETVGGILTGFTSTDTQRAVQVDASGKAYVELPSAILCSAGEGLTLTGTTFSIKEKGITSSMIGDGVVSDNHISSVSTDKLIQGINELVLECGIATIS